MSVIDLQAEREARASEAFLAYTKAKARADETRHLRDMAAAVRAWDAFITLAFPEPARREALAV
ncbi:hypothetical protein LNAOJCKE_3015 [Methylorubrum aminovorans]|uniref:Uncharacterized protein n=1 Tax=Methylorubrum aminovorans TaxID=269069 RepID=A0ABQ4UG60_9HYPH|nr:hypothetical protein [Methylorubrum aminovorans]GJE65802.1 hypothetical protein LNAOJCKE_3015 [Methylorubrum aminovorans]